MGCHAAHPTGDPQALTLRDQGTRLGSHLLIKVDAGRDGFQFILFWMKCKSFETAESCGWSPVWPPVGGAGPWWFKRHTSTGFCSSYERTGSSAIPHLTGDRLVGYRGDLHTNALRCRLKRAVRADGNGG